MTVNQQNELWDLISAQQYSAALALFQQVSTSPHNPEELMIYGYILSGLQRYDEAASIYLYLQQTWHGQPQEHIALHQRGMVERERGTYEEALRIFEEERDMIHLLPDHERLKAMKYAVNGYELGVNNLHLGRLDEAQRVLTAALQQALEAQDPMTLGCVYRAWGDYHTVNTNQEQALSSYHLSEQEFLKAGDAIAVQELHNKMNSLEAEAP